jgi:hypothetical protein
MARRVVYTCDKCKTDNDTDLFRVMLSVTDYTGTKDRYAEHQEWCEECVSSAGIQVKRPLQSQRVTPPPPPSLEDMIRQIVRDEIPQQ